MYKVAVFSLIVVAAGSSIRLASVETPPQAPSANERMRQALDPEGGVQVYMDPEGNVETLLDPPGDEPRITVQPPQSPSMDFGPPLQLNRPPFQLPPTVTVPHAPSQAVPQKAR